jgi:hypothetical protein
MADKSAWFPDPGAREIPKKVIEEAKELLRQVRGLFQACC